MVKQKKMSKTSIAVIVLALLLVLSMIMGITGAWFTDKVDFPNKQSETLGFGKVDIEGVGATTIGYTIYEKTAEGEKDYLQLIDGDKITITDETGIENNSNVDILYVVVKTLGVEVKAGTTELDDLTKANVLSWLKKGGVSLTEENRSVRGNLQSGAPLLLIGEQFNGDYVVDSNGAANALKVEGTFKITVTVHAYAVQKGNLLVAGDAAATLANVKAAFKAAGYADWDSLTEAHLAEFGLAQ